MFGLDTTALIIGFAAGVVLWGGLSFVIEWVTKLIKARNTPDYPAEVARLNGRVLELESALKDATNGTQYELGELQSNNQALMAELSEHQQATANAQDMLSRASDTEAALAETTARAERAEATLEEAKSTLIAAERALQDLAQRYRESLNEIQERSSAPLNGGGHAPYPAPPEDGGMTAYEDDAAKTEQYRS